MGWRARCIFGVGFLATALTAAVPITHADVTVEQKPVEIERKTFDPNHRPPEMPALKPGEAAVTESRFDCDADISYKIIERKTGDETCAVSLRVQAVHRVDKAQRLALRLVRNALRIAQVQDRVVSAAAHGGHMAGGDGTPQHASRRAG